MTQTGCKCWHSSTIALLTGLVFLFACESPPAVDYSGPISEWPEYGASKGGGRYSPLTQITPQNVAHLKVAWTYHTGDVSFGTPTQAKSAFQATPIVVDGTLYVCTPFNRVLALDPETGAERWTYDPGLNLSGPYQLMCRGVSTWLDPERAAGDACRRRIFTGTMDARLIALDAATGVPCADFGNGGQVALTTGIGHTYPWEYGISSPPLVIGDLVAVGTLVADNQRVDAPGGVVRAYDARTGALRWSWDPVPPGSPPLSPEAGADGVRYRRGTANAWSILSGDPERGLIFVPTGNTAPDYYGGERAGLDYYSSSVVALSAVTGQVVWHFQTVHHDLWDYDVAAQPTLFAFPGEGGSVPALAQATKMGHLFFLHRETGVPLFPVEERPVPQGAAPGETLSPTQPFPTRPPPLHPTTLTPDEAWGLTPWDRGKCRDRIAALRSEGIFTPPSLQGSIHYPGAGGGINWGSVAIDPARGLLIVNTMRLPIVIKLIPRAEYETITNPNPLVFSPQTGTPYGLQREPLLSPLGGLCSPPPWGALVGVDLATGAVRWEVPLGTSRDKAPFPFWFRWGVPNVGGPIVTAGGLVFIAATTDNFLRAFDIATGAELWKGRLPAGGQATPLTYRLREDGKQFVVIAAGGHGGFETTLGDALVAFALP